MDSSTTGAPPQPHSDQMRLIPSREGRRIARPSAKLLAFCAYLVAALVLTFPAWSDPATRWPGVAGDPTAAMNFLGWYPFALTHGINPLVDTFVNLPQGSNMMWNASIPVLALAMWPVTALFGVVVAYNVALLLALALDGWCTFLWLRDHVRHASAAWLGGLLMVLGPYAATEATSHLLLLLFFPIPLLALATERVVRYPGHSNLRWGAAIGAVAAVQLLLSEEILGLSVIVICSGVVIAGLLAPRDVPERLLPLTKTFGVAAALFLVITAVPLLYQFLGPGRITGLFQPPNVYVTDVVNLVIPNGYTALVPPFSGDLASHWTGGTGEALAYIGAPLLLVWLWTVLRWWRDRWLLVVGLTALAALVWSFGPYLHIDGVTHHLLPLPGRLFSYVQGLSNVIPSRFALLLDLGLAAVIAVFTDRAVFRGRWPSRAVSIAAVLLVCASLAPQMPIAAWNAGTPRYFTDGGDVQRLAPGTTALVVPFGAYSELTLGPLLWQAQSAFRLRIVSVAIYAGGPDGMSIGLPSVIQLEQHAWSVPPSAGSDPGRALHATTLACVMDALESSLPLAPCGTNVIAESREDLHSLGVSVIILGPMAYGTDPTLQRTMEDFLTRLAGASPHPDQGVMLWSAP